MQCAFEQLLSYAGKVSHKTLKFPKADDVAKSDLKSEIECVYGKLDGILPSSPLNLRHWDTEFDEIAVELDEELHFNRYRSITLKSAIYTRLPQSANCAMRQNHSDRGHSQRRRFERAA